VKGGTPITEELLREVFRKAVERVPYPLEPPLIISPKHAGWYIEQIKKRPVCGFPIPEYGWQATCGLRAGHVTKCRPRREGDL
jgi:hypothetical protein